MEKFDKNLNECGNRFEKWLWVFKNLPNLENVPHELLNDMLVKVFKIAEVAKLNATEREAYQRSLKYLRDLHNVVDSAFFEGELKGKMEEQMKVIVNGHNQGLSFEMLSVLTGWSLDEIVSFLKSKNLF